LTATPPLSARSTPATSRPRSSISGTRPAACTTRSAATSLSPSAPRGALEAGVQALTLLTDRRLEWDVARYSRDVELILLPAANRMRVQPVDFDHSRRLIKEALTAAREFLARRDTPVTARVAV
jgi:hypothetical protein